jgi:cation diffusion facilitator family transporter
MSKNAAAAAAEFHSHNFLGVSHGHHERKAWNVILLCSLMMIVEIVGGSLFGSLALIADGLHMSTHAGAMLIAALAYTYARRHVHDRRFAFGTGKLGDLAGFTSAIVLAMIALLIGYEAVLRWLSPQAIRFEEAIPIAVAGLLVNIASAWMLSGDESHGHSHGHPHEPAHAHAHEHGHGHGHAEHRHPAQNSTRSTSAAQHRDNNLRSAYVHVIADAAVSVLAIVGLLLARSFGWLWMDPLAGVIGALVIANWSWRLLRDTGGILLDMNPDAVLSRQIRETLEADGDRLVDLHLWRLGPSHLGAVLAVVTREARDPAFYRARLAAFRTLSHVTVEVVAASATESAAAGST